MDDRNDKHSSQKASKRLALAAMITLVASAGTTTDAIGEMSSTANSRPVAGQTTPSQTGMLLHSVPASERVTFQAPFSSAVITMGVDRTGVEPSEANRVTGTTSADVENSKPSYAKHPWTSTSSENLKPYIAPDSLADMVRLNEPQRALDSIKDFEAGLSMPSDVESQFDVTREFESTHSINHVGRPVHTDAVNVQAPDFEPASTKSQLNVIVSDVPKLPANFSASEPESSSLKSSTGSAVNSEGFTMFSVHDLQPPQHEQLLPAAESPSPTATSTIHARRLGKLARAALADSRSRLRKRATHTAQKHALEALRLSVDIEDAIRGGNQHAGDLRVAQNAIRESKDFEGITTTVDWRSIQRMVAVHETEILKSKDLKHVSAVQATDAYLNLARTKLVSAAGDSALAAESMLLLGLIEKQVLSRADIHSGAVSLIYHGAAIEICPANAEAHREYGRTLLEQGLVNQSIQSLKQSVALKPSRAGYQVLLDASRRGGDYDLAKHCLNALNNPSLLNDTAIVQLPPRQFAASYRPTPQTIHAVPSPVSSKATATNVEPEKEKTRISFRSFFPFGRR